MAGDGRALVDALTARGSPPRGRGGRRFENWHDPTASRPALTRAQCSRPKPPVRPPVRLEKIALAAESPLLLVFLTFRESVQSV